MPARPLGPGRRRCTISAPGRCSRSRVDGRRRCWCRSARRRCRRSISPAGRLVVAAAARPDDRQAPAKRAAAAMQRSMTTAAPLDGARPDHLSRDVSRAARRRRSPARRWPPAAGAWKPWTSAAFARDKHALRRRRAVRRRSRHGDAAGRGRCGDRSGARASPAAAAADLPDAARPAVRSGSGARTCRRPGRDRCCAGATKGSTSGCSTRAGRRRSASAISSCRAASRRRWR